jgi:hypothetical protein
MLSTYFNPNPHGSPFSRLLRHAWECWVPILTRIPTCHQERKKSNWFEVGGQSSRSQLNFIRKGQCHYRTLQKRIARGYMSNLVLFYFHILSTKIYLECNKTFIALFLSIHKIFFFYFSVPNWFITRVLYRKSKWYVCRSRQLPWIHRMRLWNII